MTDLPAAVPYLSLRERALRGYLRQQKRQRWRHVAELLAHPSALRTWMRYMTDPTPTDWLYCFGFPEPSRHLSRHIRIELHFIRRQLRERRP